VQIREIRVSLSLSVFVRVHPWFNCRFQNQSPGFVQIREIRVSLCLSVFVRVHPWLNWISRLWRLDEELNRTGFLHGQVRFTVAALVGGSLPKRIIRGGDASGVRGVDKVCIRTAPVDEGTSGDANASGAWARCPAFPA